MKNLTPRRAALRAAFPATIPVMTGFLCLGLAYGVLMQSKGYGPLWSTLMSAVAFGGSMQFVAITLLTTAFDPVQAFLLSVMVNARHIFYGLPVSVGSVIWLRGPAWCRIGRWATIRASALF